MEKEANIRPVCIMRKNYEEERIYPHRITHRRRHYRDTCSNCSTELYERSGTGKNCGVQSDQKAYSTAMDMYMLDHNNKVPEQDKIWHLTTPVSYIASMNLILSPQQCREGLILFISLIRFTLSPHNPYPMK